MNVKEGIKLLCKYFCMSHERGIRFCQGGFQVGPAERCPAHAGPAGQRQHREALRAESHAALGHIPGPQLCTMNATVTPEGLSGIPGFEFTELEVASLHFHRQTIRAGHEAMAPQPHALSSGPL